MKKIVFIVFAASIESEIMKALEGCCVSNYTKFPDIHGKGNHSEPHLDTPVWPGTNHGLLVAADPDKKDRLLERIRELKSEYANEGIKAFVLPLEEIV